MQELNSAQRRELRAQAHDLNPVVSIAENGLTESVLKEIDNCLKAHELIKIRVYGDSRDDRIAYYEQICSELGAAPRSTHRQTAGRLPPQRRKSCRRGEKSPGRPP